ncbi:GlcNAc-PI de-N-acetylase [Homoserinimonas aerilata]|uniref:GlcNAc-PI de-N-acetylase n=1 Tax=Homoserinimonas aerilata TaxID=1162970 RepID=A0A542YH64_9MICO|nr:response regulator [Homoserinimonas aerilata]TQL47439.1 GlcNAc-PI de-N-acetylase [Homoserinimonas aerilata]
MAEPYRVIVVEDDEDVAFYIKTVLTKQGCIVQTFTDPSFARQAMLLYEPDVVITDIEMPGITGIELIDQVRAVRPGTPVVVMTAHVSVDYAVEALRHNADEFLTKPIASADLISIVTRLANEFRNAKANVREREVVLAIGAHPDDVEIGVGGILLAHRAAGDAVHILTLSRGGRGGHVTERQGEAFEAARLLDATLHLEDLPDTEIPEVDPTQALIQKVVDEVRPSIVYVHSDHDMHQDHRAVHKAALVATRAVRSVSCYQSASATVDFRPNRFVNIDGYLEGKLALVQTHRSQLSASRYHAPDFLAATARYWSRFGDGAAAEPLEIVRDSGDVSNAPVDVAQALRAHREQRARQLAQ